MKKQYFLPLLTLSLSFLLFLNINLDFVNAQCMPPYGCGSEGYTPPGSSMTQTQQTVGDTTYNINYDSTGDWYSHATHNNTPSTGGHHDDHHDHDDGNDGGNGDETPSDGGGGCGNGGGNGGESGGGNGGESGGGNGGESGGGNGGESGGGNGGESGGGNGTSSEEPCYKTCYVNSCHGCCCKTDPQRVKCEKSCPRDQCSSNCDCCGGNGSCYPRVFLDIDPPKLFVNQSFNLSYEAEGDSCCGGLRCTVTGTYQGFNCGQSGMIGICPSDAQGVNVCDPKNQLRSLTSSSGRATITTHSQYWGNCLYKVTCTNSCGNSSSDTQTVMTVPVPLWGEESPISNLLSPLKPFISLFSL